VNKIKLFALPFILSFIVLYLSLNHDIWITFWKTLNIPAVIPPFSDLDSILKTNLSKNHGYNVYLENPYDPSHGLYVYPSIWLNIFDFLKLDNLLFFKIFNFTIILSYFFIIQDLFIKTFGKLSNLLIIFFFF